jgi:hypothetical protein
MLILGILIRKGLQGDGISFEGTNKAQVGSQIQICGSMMDGDIRNINEFTISVQLQ